MPEQQKTPNDNNEIRYQETKTLIPKLRRVHVAAALVWLWSRRTGHASLPHREPFLRLLLCRNGFISQRGF